MTDQPVRFASRDWVWIVCIIVGAAVSNITFVYATAQTNRVEMMKQVERLDESWQERIVEVTKDVKEDIGEVKREVKEVKNSIPPDWFRRMVEKNQEDIEELRSLIKRGNE